MSRSPPTAALLRLALGPLAIGLLGLGCHGLGCASGERTPALARSYGGDADGLRALWSDILAAARRGDRADVRRFLAAQRMTDEDVRALFPACWSQVYPQYRMLFEQFVDLGSHDLIEQTARQGFDSVEVLPMAHDNQFTLGPFGAQVLEQAAPGVPLHSVRLHHAGVAGGARYFAFTHRQGRWLAGLGIGRFLAAAARERSRPGR